MMLRQPGDCDGRMPAILRRIAREGVVSHHATDLDQVMALEALRRAARVDALKGRPYRRRPTRGGPDKRGWGDARTVEGITVLPDGTVMIGHHFNAYHNTLEVLAQAGVYVPSRAVANADKADSVSVLDWRMGLSFFPCLTSAQLWEMAEAGAQDRCLTGDELQGFGLADAVVTAVRKHAVNDSLVFVPEYVRYGAQVAYEPGYRLYCLVAPHENGGVTLGR